jgi:FkbM family methyltransferase
MAADGELDELFKDIAERLPAYAPSVIFDVGANVGATVLTLARRFPEARIFAFEPVASTFARLRRATEPLANVTPVQTAFGSRPTRGTMTAVPEGVGNRLVQEPATTRQPLEEIEVSTAELFCRANGLSHISLLKIDTEGHDLEVIRGLGSLLESVDFIQAEVSMNPYNRAHASFTDIFNHMIANGFLLFKIYNQMMEFQLGGRPALRRADPVFINRKLVGKLP